MCSQGRAQTLLVASSPRILLRDSFLLTHGAYSQLPEGQNRNKQATFCFLESHIFSLIYAKFLERQQGPHVWPPQWRPPKVESPGH